MSLHIPASLREQVLTQARGYCAYCRSPEDLLGVAFEIDHIIPQAAGGETSIENLCLSCPVCNRHKAARQVAFDPVTGANTPLFHPVVQRWNDLFTWSEDGTTLIGLTPEGRGTILLLRINRPVLVQMRRYWVALGLHPSL